jgi:hypothetical protein
MKDMSSALQMAFADKEKLETTRDILAEHLNALYAEEITIDNYDDNNRRLTDALEYCLEMLKDRLNFLKIVDKMIEANYQTFGRDQDA